MTDDRLGITFCRLGILPGKKNLDFRIKIRNNDSIYVPPLKKMIAHDDVEPQSSNLDISQ